MTFLSLTSSVRGAECVASLVVRPFTELSGIASTVASFGMCRWSSLTFRYARCSAASPRGTRCDSAFNVRSCDLKMKQHTKVPIEGVGVVHVITKPSDNPDYAETDMMLSRYNGGTPVESSYLTGSITERDAALEMHKHWCDWSG